MEEEVNGVQAPNPRASACEVLSVGTETFHHVATTKSTVGESLGEIQKVRVQLGGSIY